MEGQVAVLNVGAGDTKLSFDPNNPQECIRASRIVKDMLRRGYALLVDKGDGTYARVHEFDDTKYEYVIADFDPIVADEHDSQEMENGEKDKPGTAAAPATATQKPRRGRPPGRRIPASGAHAVAVSRTAGG